MSSSTPGPSTEAATKPTPAMPHRGKRLLRAGVAMVLFAIPVALLAFAVRQEFDPLIRFDNSVITALTDFTREHGLADR